MEQEAISRANYWNRAKAFVKTSDVGWFAIELDTSEYRVWSTYFRGHLRWLPVGMRYLEAKRLSTMTVPAQWPEWFDATFAADRYAGKDVRLPDERERAASPEVQARIADGFRQLGAAMRAKADAMKVRRPSSYQPPNDDDLRALYPAKQGEAAE